MGVLRDLRDVPGTEGEEETSNHGAEVIAREMSGKKKTANAGQGKRRQKRDVVQQKQCRRGGACDLRQERNRSNLGIVERVVIERRSGRKVDQPGKEETSGCLRGGVPGVAVVLQVVTERSDQGGSKVEHPSEEE